MLCRSVIHSFGQREWAPLVGEWKASCLLLVYIFFPFVVGLSKGEVHPDMGGTGVVSRGGSALTVGIS